MQYSIFPLVSTRTGRKLGEFPLGSVSFNEDGLKVDLPDAAVQRRVEALFTNPLRIRRAAGEINMALTYTWEELEPGSEEHFQEAVARLHHLGYGSKLESY